MTELAIQAPCSVPADYPPYPAGGSIPGFWELTLQGTVPTGTHFDADTSHPLDEVSFTYLEEDCSAFVMDVGGMWHPSAPGEVF